MTKAVEEPKFEEKRFSRLDRELYIDGWSHRCRREPPHPVCEMKLRKEWERVIDGERRKQHDEKFSRVSSAFAG